MTHDEMVKCVEFIKAKIKGLHFQGETKGIDREITSLDTALSCITALLNAIDGDITKDAELTIRQDEVRGDKKEAENENHGRGKK